MPFGVVQQAAATTGRTVKLFLLISCACLLAGPPLLSQGAQEETAVEEASPVRPEELVSQTEEVREQVRQILAAFEDDSAYLAMENALVASTEQVSAQAGEALSRIEGASSLESLNTILVPWTELQEQAREWDRSVASRVRQLREGLEGLEAVRSSWEAAETQAGEEELPDSILSSISSTLEVIESASRLLNDRRSSLLTLQQQISEHLLTISPIFEEADRVAVLELRGGTHLVITPGVITSGAITPGDEPVSEGADAPFDLMVDDIEEAHDRYAAAGLEPSDIASGAIHSSFGMVAPSGHVVTVNSSHVGDRPV